MPDKLNIPEYVTPDSAGYVWQVSYEIPPTRGIFFDYADGITPEQIVREAILKVHRGAIIRGMSRVQKPAPKLRVLSLWQPWATLMAIGQKKFETRSWETGYRGLVCIHASKKWGRELEEITKQEPFRTVLHRVRNDANPIPLGCVLAVARLQAIIHTNEFQKQMSSAPYEREFGDYGPRRFAWQFVELRRLIAPVPLKASQGLFHAPEQLRAQIANQLPELNLF